jgi:hypothetical protein
METLGTQNTCQGRLQRHLTRGLIQTVANKDIGPGLPNLFGAHITTLHDLDTWHGGTGFNGYLADFSVALICFLLVLFLYFSLGMGMFTFAVISCKVYNFLFDFTTKSLP